MRPKARPNTYFRVLIRPCFRSDYGFDVRKCRIGIDATVRYVGAKTYEDFMPIVNLDFQSMQNMKYWSGTSSARA